MSDPNDAPPPAPPSSGPWRPPERVERSTAGLVFGLVVLAVGLWYFLDRTLGVEMPQIDWRAAWPVILIVVGAVLVVRSMGRRS